MMPTSIVAVHCEVCGSPGIMEWEDRELDALEAIRKRRSVRSYTGEPIPREDIETILDAGSQGTRNQRSGLC